MENTKLNLEGTLAMLISERIGRNIADENIHSDDAGWYYYIPAKSLKINHPLIMNHYRGPLFVVIPTQDMQRMKDGKISATKYVDEAIWSYGYYWGGGSILSGVYWQFLEGGKSGINDLAKINRYLTILSCRTHLRSSGYRASEEKCRNCFVKDCPLSKLSEGNPNADWDNEVQERDARVELYNAVKTRVQKQFGLEVIYVMSDEGDEHSVRVHTIEKNRTVEIRFAESLLVNLLYYPPSDVNVLADSLDIEVVGRDYEDKERKQTGDDTKDDDGKVANFIKRSWGKTLNFIKRLF